MPSQSVCARIASKVRRVPNAVRCRLRYRLQPKALVWAYLRKYYPGQPLITALGEDLRVRIYPKDVIGRYIYIDGVFEPDSWNFVKGFLRPGMVVFDLGANLGQYTLLAARCVGEHGQVHSFEPSERIFGELKFNVELNNLSERCTLNRLAVSDVAGVARLSRYEEGAEVYGSLGSHRRSEATVLGYEEVQTVRLDDYIEGKAVDHVDFIKMDIEGAELPALKSAEKLLSRNNAPTILLEMADINADGFGYKAVEAWDFLAARGYQIFALDDHAAKLRKVARPRDFSAAMNAVAVKSFTGS